MRLLRILGVALTLGAASCSRPPPPAPASHDQPTEAAAQAALLALAPTISAEIGRPVALHPTTSNVSARWAYIVARPNNADGSPIDWSTTNLASRHENGVMDESGSVHALLRQQDGAWVVVEHVIAPTDVAWLDWAARHDVPQGVITVPAP